MPVKTKFNAGVYLRERKRIIAASLKGYMPEGRDYPQVIHQAMRYSVFTGGKRIRPILVLASCEAAGGGIKEAMPYACAIEMIHTYSLVHDDMPAMDNDDFRRGRLTCHKKFGEAVGILAGDALLTLAIELMASGRDARINNEVIKTTCASIGTYGMIGGQVVDIGERDKTNLPVLSYINAHKTGALIAASCKIGGIVSRAPESKIRALESYGEYIGFIFQVIDDILDMDGFALALGVDEARKEAGRLIGKAKGALKVFGGKADILSAIADFLLTRRK